MRFRGVPKNPLRFVPVDFCPITSKLAPNCDRMVKSMADVTIVDCAPRDGLGALLKISTHDKVALTTRLIKSGVTKIDCAAFTHPRLRPEYADAEDVINALDKQSEVTIIGLAPNEIACRRALSTNVDEIGTLIGCSESFNKLVLGTSIRETLKTFPAIFQTCLENGKTIRAYILAAFYCQYEGKVTIKEIVELASKLAHMGVTEMTLVDTPGMANPKQVKETMSALLELDMGSKLAVHFHNTHGLGLVNCLAAHEVGIRIFDTAVGGLSGTPFGAPKMEVGSWNVPTEDLVFLFHEIGVNTGINLDEIVDSVKFAQKLAGRQLTGHVSKARQVFASSNIPEPLKFI
jgi:hydroxymethylglutaryl-CoA lyase